MKNQNGDSMIIQVGKYHYDDLYNKLFDSDWLDAELIIKKSGRKVKIKLEFLIVEELERIIIWLQNLLSTNFLHNKLDFIDPNLQLKLFTRSKIKVIKILFQTNKQVIKSWEMIADKNNLNQLETEIKKIIVAFPCRCGSIHSS